MIRSQRLGVRTTRRSDGNFLEARYRAVTPLAAIMKSSIISLALVPFLGFKVLELISVKHRAGFYGFEIQRTVHVPEGLQLLGHTVLESQVLVETVRPCRSLAASVRYPQASRQRCCRPSFA